MTQNEQFIAAWVGVFAFLICQILLLWWDGKRNKQQQVRFSLMKLFPFLLLMLGFEAFAFPWVYIAGEDRGSFLQLISVSHGPSISDEIFIPGCLLYFSYWMMAITTAFELLFRVSVKSKLTLYLQAMLGLGSSYLGFLLISCIPPAYVKQYLFFGEKVEVTIGFDLYLGTAIGIMYTAFVLWMNYNNLKKRRQPGL